MIIYTTPSKIYGTRYQQLQARVRSNGDKISIELFRLDGKQHKNVATIVGDQQELSEMAEAIQSISKGE